MLAAMHDAAYLRGMQNDTTISTSSSADGRDASGRFLSGNRCSLGKGRPRGSRALLSDVFLTDVLEAWQRDGASALARVAAEEPGTFLKVVASVLPKQIEQDVTIGIDVGDFVARFRHAVELLGNDPEQARPSLSCRTPKLINGR